MPERKGLDNDIITLSESLYDHMTIMVGTMATSVL